jgi:TPR repeat protein
MREGDRCRAIATATLALVVSTVALADDFADCSEVMTATNPERAVAACLRLAKQGNAGAQRNLGAAYELGHGAPQDFKEAVKWYRKAAEQGDASAQAGLGAMYANGQGVSEDDNAAVKWFRRAADQGSGIGQRNLGLMYETGRGVPQDYVLAYLWFNLAAASMPAGLRDDSVMFRDRVANKMTPSQIEEAQRLARNWKPRVAQPE